MNKICYGCGCKLQNTDKEKIGYTPKEDSNYCQRCFRLMHYGIDSENMPFKTVDNILDSVNKDNKFVCFLTDLFNINSKIIDSYHRIKNNKVLLISKSDLIPKNIKLSKIKNFLKEYYQIDEDIIFISNSHRSAQKVISYLQNHNINETYLMGLTSSGKSTLINNMLDVTNSKLNKVVTSYRQNTTLDFIRLQINDILVIDSPGFILKTLNINNKDTFKYAVKPRTYQMRKNEVLRLIDESFIGFEKDTSACFYIPNNIKSHKDYKQKAFNYTLHVESDSDLIILGLGFLNIKNETDLYFYNLDRELIEIRPSIFRK